MIPKGWGDRPENITDEEWAELQRKGWPVPYNPPGAYLESLPHSDESQVGTSKEE